MDLLVFTLGGGPLCQGCPVTPTLRQLMRKNLHRTSQHVCLSSCCKRVPCWSTASVECKYSVMASASRVLQSLCTNMAYRLYKRCDSMQMSFKIIYCTVQEASAVVVTSSRRWHSEPPAWALVARHYMAWPGANLVGVQTSCCDRL